MRLQPPLPIATQDALSPIAPYSQAIDVGDLVFVSGNVGVDPDTRKIPEGIRDETRFLMDQIQAVLETAGLSMHNICKTTIFITDFEQYAAMNDVYKEYFETYPARSTVKVAGLLLDARVEIEAIAVRPE